MGVVFFIITTLVPELGAHPSCVWHGSTWDKSPLDDKTTNEHLTITPFTEKLRIASHSDMHCLFIEDELRKPQNWESNLCCASL